MPSMAKKTPPIADAEEETPASKERKANRELLEEVRENFKLDLEAEHANRENFRKQMQFCYVPGAQWEDAVKKARGPKRITREFNEVRVKVKAVVNHIRSNRPTAKIRGVEEGDVETAEAMNGMALNVWNVSDADNVTDFAAETQVAAGLGAWMIDTEYSDDSVADQDIFIRPIANPLCLVWDRACKEQDKSDARHWSLFTNYSKDAYEERFGKATKVASFDTQEFNAANDPNTDDETVWVVAYWKKVPITKNLCLLSSGETVDKATVTQLPEGVTIIKERAVKTHKIVQYICSATEILEGPNDWAGKEFPFIVAFGEYVVIDGKPVWFGMTQTMMDAQRAHNETLSGVYETIALSPQAKYWATAEQGKGLFDSWQRSIDENLPAMLYNADPKAPGPPVRVGGADVPVALMQAASMSRESMNSVSAVPDASVGMPSNESSGRAIRARQDAGMVGTYNYSDNIAKAIGRTYKILIDIIPKVIDTPRSLRILGKDGAEKFIKVNQLDPITGQVINDLSKGKYDFVVTQGPNVATQRQEASETLTQLAQSDQMLMPTAADIVYRNLDIPGAQEIAERRRALLPPPILAVIDKDKPQDPRVVAAMQQVQQADAQVQQQAQMVQQATVQAQGEQAQADKAKGDVQVAMSNLKVQEADLARQVAEFKALMAETKAQMVQQASADKDAKAEQEDAADAAAAQMLQVVEQQLQQTQAAYAQLQESVAQTQQLAVAVAGELQKPKPPSQKVARSKRTANGEIHTLVTDQATGEEQLAVSKKVNGEIITYIEPSAATH